MNISDYDHLSVPLPKVKDPTPYFPNYRPTPSISSPLRQVVNNGSNSIGNSSRQPIIPNLNLTPPPSPTLTFDHQPNLKCPNEPKDPNEFNLPPHASIARASSSLEPQTTTTNKIKSPMQTSSKQKNQASSSYPVYPDHQGSMRDGFVENIHHTQRIPLIENYGQGLGWIERRQLIPIEESAVKKCGNNIVGDNRLAKVFIPNMPLIMRSQSCEKIMGNPQSSLQQMNIEHNKIENCKGTPAKASSSCPVITLQAMLKMMMGEKIYSESRQTIINHQQIFTYQVSELHRIVAVQKELIKSNAQQSKPLKSDTYLLPKSSPKPSRNEASTIQIMGSYPRPTNLQNSNVGNTIINTFPTLYLPSQGNQLLLPMISPTEGLIYKICPSLPNGVYTYVQPHSSMQNMKSSSEFSPSPSSCVIRDHETNPNEVKDPENVNSTPTNPTSLNRLN